MNWFEWIYVLQLGIFLVLISISTLLGVVIAKLVSIKNELHFKNETDRYWHQREEEKEWRHRQNVLAANRH